MSDKTKDRSFYKDLKAALEEGILHAQGKLTLRTTTFTVPDTPPELTAREVFALRQRLNLTQFSFARLLNVSLKTVQSWEQGNRKPSQAALRLLQVLGEKPEVVCEALGIAALVNGTGRRTAKATSKKVK